jgi:hypothetical protein
VLASPIATPARRHPDPTPQPFARAFGASVARARQGLGAALLAAVVAVAPLAQAALAAPGPPAEASAGDVSDGVLDDEERATIEWLIARVAAMPELRFVRNGRAYDAAAAVRFLRGKWEANAGDVTSVEGFIVIVATRSSTTGRSYLIRHPDGREVPSAEFFRALVSAPSTR